MKTENREDAALIITTTDDEAVAKRIAERLVEARLAAGVQIDAVDSIYRWQGAVHAHPERRLTIKTRRAHYAAVESLIRAEHNYELPQIVMIAIAAGFADYLRWIADETTTDEA